MKGATRFLPYPTFWTSVAHWIVPQCCALCRAPSQHKLCNGCIDELPWMQKSWISTFDTTHPLLFREQHLKGVVAPLQYCSPVDGFIQAFKYHGQTPWVSTLATWIAYRWPEEIPWPTLWIPIPLHASRYRERGFNQSVMLARALSRLRGGEVDTQLLKRIQTTSSAARQKLTIQARAQQVDGSFFVSRLDQLPHTACLVDDVLTTGATLSAAAQTLKSAGINTILAAVIARTLSPESS